MSPYGHAVGVIFLLIGADLAYMALWGRENFSMNKLTYFDIHSLNSEKPKVFDWACSSYAETEEYVKKMNATKVGGFDDWRLPTVHEASSIYDKEKLNKDFKGSDIHLDSVFPLGPGNCTWTSSTRGKEAQILFYMNGCAYWYGKDDKTISHGARLVRRDS